jgi:hypothetical protein
MSGMTTVPSFSAYEMYEYLPGNANLALVQPLQPSLIDNLPNVPALPETLLLMEMKLYDFSIDLREVTELVRRDLGATLQILRLASREYGSSEDRPMRLEDCISDLGLRACLDAAGHDTICNDNGPLFEFWAHARHVAQAARIVAANSGGTIHPDEAELVGLFHSLGGLPTLLGWELGDHRTESWIQRALRMAERWSLPACVHAYFMQLQHPETPGAWASLIRAVHHNSTKSFVDCAFHEKSNGRCV